MGGPKVRNRDSIATACFNIMFAPFGSEAIGIRSVGSQDDIHG